MPKIKFGKTPSKKEVDEVADEAVEETPAKVAKSPVKKPAKSIRKPKPEPAPEVNEETQAEEYAEELESQEEAKPSARSIVKRAVKEAVEPELEKEPEELPRRQLIKRAPTAGPVQRQVSGDDDGGDAIEFGDINVPKINIAQKVGELGEKFPPGSLVFGQTLELDNPCTVIVLAAQPKVFVERVAGGGLGQIANTRQEVAELGGTLDYNEAERTKKPWYQDSVTFILLLLQPEEVDDPHMFNLEFDGNRFAMALITLKGASFTEGAKTLFTARRVGTPFNLTGGYNSKILSLSTWLKQHRTGNKSYVPKFEEIQDTPEELRDWVTALLKGD